MFEWLKGLFSPKDLQGVGYNPRNGKIGQSVEIDDLDYNYNWNVTNIHQYSSRIGEFIDYDLKAYDCNGEVRAKLRVYESKTLLLIEYDRLDFCEGLYEVLQNPQDSMRVDDEKINLHEEYFRPNESRRNGNGYATMVKTLTDKNGDGIVSYNETLTSRLVFWNYERTTVLEGVETKQYLFVELHPPELPKNHYVDISLEDTRTFTLYRGREVHPSKVTFY